MYSELHSCSAFSFLQGASLPEELAEECARLGLPALALLDADGVYGAPRFHLAAKRLGLRVHIGAEITATLSPQRHPEKLQNEDCRLQIGSEHSRDSSIFNLQSTICNPCARLPLLADSRAGYQNLCRLITCLKLRAPKHGETAADADDLAAHAAGLICLTGGDDGPLAAALAQGGLDAGRRCLEHLIALFGRDRVYVELQRHFNRAEEARNQAAVELARAFGLPLLATNGVAYATADRREVLDVFTCLHHHRTLATAGRLLARNSERHLKSGQEMQQLFADLPEAIASTEALSARLGFTLADLGYEFPRYPVPTGESMMSFLRKRTQEGTQARYGRAAPELRARARRQIERELALIEKLDLAGYFLIVWDLVRFCREQGILA